MILVRSPLRISFAGEGSDIASYYEKYGGSVCSVTIDKYTYITAKHPATSRFNKPFCPHKYRLVYSQIEECSSIAEIKHPIIRTIMPDLGPNGLDLYVVSDIPAGTGLGSSSALTVGLCKAAYHYSMDKHMISEEACDIDINNLKEPIGKHDHYSASFGGLSCFTFDSSGVEVSPILLSDSQENDLLDHLFLIHAGKTRPVSNVLSELKELGPELGDLAIDAATAIKRNRLDWLGEIVQEDWDIKKGLSPFVSNDYIDALIKTGVDNGAYGGKLLGAGEGGFVLLVCSRENTNRMVTALKALDPHYVSFRFDKEGCKLLYGD